MHYEDYKLDRLMIHLAYSFDDLKKEINTMDALTQGKLDKLVADEALEGQGIDKILAALSAGKDATDALKAQVDSLTAANADLTSKVSADDAQVISLQAQVDADKVAADAATKEFQDALDNLDASEQTNIAKFPADAPVTPPVVADPTPAPPVEDPTPVETPPVDTPVVDPTVAG